MAGKEQQFCCAGCEAVWNILHECSLDEYYHLRDRFGEKPGNPAKISGRSYDFLDDPAFLTTHGQRRAGGMLLRFYLDGVHCIACSWLVEKVLIEREHVKYARLDIGKSVVEIVFNPAEVRLSRIARALDRIGYTPHPVADEMESAARRRETKTLLARLGIAAASAGNIMLLAVSQYAGDFTGIERNYSSLFRWVSLGLVLPAVLYSAYPYYRGAWSGLRRGVLHMDLPISLGILASFSISLAATVLGRGEVYYDSVAMLIFLLLAGRLVVHRAGRWAAEAGETLLSLATRSVRRIETGTVRDALLSDIHPGDVIELKPGDVVPVDGELASAEAWIGESFVTGEPATLHRMRGDSVLAGATVERSPIQLGVTAVGETTRIARLAHMMRDASARRAPIMSVMDRIAGYFVAAVLGLAALTLLIWLKLDPSHALWNMAALLVVACPCAIGLATPVAFAVAMGRAAKRGIFIRGQDGIERLASADHIILDKTGTLTEGQLTVVRSLFSSEIIPGRQREILRDVAALERYSGHVVASAFQDIAAEGIQLRECRTIPGVGVEGWANDVFYVVGSETLIADRVSDIPPEMQAAKREFEAAALTLVWVARDHQTAAVLGLGDRIRTESKAAVADLRKLGMDVEMLSGDQPKSVAAAAAELGIERFAGRMSPEAKLARVETLIAQGKDVTMIGDGVNDAAALGRATVGISAAGSSEVARDAADVFIALNRGPTAISEAIRLARRTMRIIRLNLAVAIAYNAVGAALAITGHITPLAAAILMPISSLTVLAIASRA